jgi:hypothetical protein
LELAEGQRLHRFLPRSVSMLLDNAGYWLLFSQY